MVCCHLTSRGGVEDTRLEAKAKAKDTKKIRGQEAKDSLSEDRHSRGQGQECSRPRPRTKDTKRKCSPKKKKGLHKNFSGDLRKKKKKKGLHKNFSGISEKKKKKKVFTKIFQAISEKKKKKGLHKNFSSDLHEKTLSKQFFNRSTKF